MYDYYEGFRNTLEELWKTDEGSCFKVLVRIPADVGWIERVKISVSTFNSEQSFQLEFLQRDEKFVYFENKIYLKRCAIYTYYFSYEANGRFQYYKKINLTKDNTKITKEEYFKLSVGFNVPDWAKGAIMYHIFVDRYRKAKDSVLPEMKNRTIHTNWDESPVLGPDENGNWNIDFFGGNLKGIEETLDYIKSFGTTIIYLSPIVESQSNHRYDTGDYENVDPYVGTNEGLKQLCDSAHRKGMKVILDGVFNHVGNDSKYFNEYGNYDNVGAFQSEDSPYNSFFRRRWINGKNCFEYWWGMTNLPECNGYSKEWNDYILGENGILDQWYALGIDGLRLDVADELCDEFIEGIRSASHRNKEDSFIIGEVWKNPMRMNRGYISSGKGMDSVMNYQLVDGVLRYYKYCDVNKLRNVVNEILTEYPDDTIHTLMNFTSTHDISRLIEICGCNDFNQYSEWGWNLINESIDWVKNHEISRDEYVYGKKVLKSYIFALCFMPGIFSIFYGDEVGAKGIGNLMNRCTYPWEKRDKDLLKFFRTICKCRNSQTFLKTADLNLIDVNESLLNFERYDNDDNKILVFTSRSHHPTNIYLPPEYKDAKIICSLKNCTKDTLAPYGAIAFKK